MKKLIHFFLVITMLITSIFACNNNNSSIQTTFEQSATEQANTKNIKIVTTIFPIYDWVKNILGENFNTDNVSLLLNNNVDLHNYQPTSADLLNISNSDLFIYVGGESDEWVHDVLNQSQNKNLKAVNLLELLGDEKRPEEEKEGMEEDHEHNHEHDHMDITESDIKDRSLIEFNGEWKSLYPMLQNGELDSYVEEHSKEHNEDFQEVKNELQEKWESDIKTIKINNDTITFEKIDGSIEEAKYEYKGYSIVKDEDGEIKNVRYRFATEDNVTSKFVEFNDHEYMPVEAVEHFHIYVGNENFEALDNSKNNPYFVMASLDKDSVVEHLSEGHKEEYDEHVWLSLKNAKKLVSQLTNIIKEIDKENANLYETNASKYIEKLQSLDKSYADVLKSAQNKMLIFGDRFPFLYMTKDYNLDYYAAFKGCSAETEASFKTIAFLTQKLDEYNLNYVMTIEGTNHKIAETIIQNSNNKNREILTLNSIQSINTKDIENGIDYLSIMQNNLDILKKALN